MKLDPDNYFYEGLNNCSSTLTLDQRSIGVLFFNWINTDNLSSRYQHPSESRVENKRCVWRKQDPKRVNYSEAIKKKKRTL